MRSPVDVIPRKLTYVLASDAQVWVDASAKLDMAKAIWEVRLGNRCYKHPFTRKLKPG